MGRVKKPNRIAEGWEDWAQSGYPLPGEGVHHAMMPYARSSAALARAKGKAGETFREAAVLVGIESDGRIVLIQRTQEKGPHGGQMALPGGAREAKESLRDCAIREWREELGLNALCVPVREPVPLTEVHVVPSGFVVRPFLAEVALPESLEPEEREVARVYRIHLNDLVDPQYRTKHPVRVHAHGVQNFRWDAPGFALPDTPFIWGATALILSEVAAWTERWVCRP